MFGEKPVRQRVTPISSAMETKRFLKISNSIGSRRIGCLCTCKSSMLKREKRSKLYHSALQTLPCFHFARLQPCGDEGADTVDGKAIVWRDDGGRLSADDERGALSLHASGEQFAVIDGSL